MTFGTETDNKELSVAMKNQHTKVFVILKDDWWLDDGSSQAGDIVTHNVSSLITKLYGEKIAKSGSSAKPLYVNETIVEEDENNTDIEPISNKTKDDNSSLCKCMLMVNIMYNINMLSCYFD